MRNSVINAQDGPSEYYKVQLYPNNWLVFSFLSDPHLNGRFQGLVSEEEGGERFS